MDTKILFVSHELSMTGAPIMMLEAIKILLAKKYNITVLSLKDGPMKKELESLGVSVIIWDADEEKSEYLSVYGDFFDLIFINTFVCVSAVKTFLNSQVPVIWWIHEGDYVIPNFKGILPEELSENFHLVSVSHYTQKILLDFSKDYDSQVLYNGIKNEISMTELKNDEYKHTFVCIGGIEKRKGQDIVLRAIDELDDKNMDDFRFLFIGKVFDQEMKDLLDKYCERYPFVSYKAAMPRKEVLSIIRSSYAVIAPSRDDPGPLTAGEAMMLGVPAIVSDKTGIAGLITDKMNGLVFKNEDYAGLSEIIKWCMNNSHLVGEIGENGREIYTDYFDGDKYNDKFMDIVESILGNSRKNKVLNAEAQLDVMNELIALGLSNEKKLNHTEKQLMENEQTINKKNQVIQEKEAVLAEKETALAEKEAMLVEKNRVIAQETALKEKMIEEKIIATNQNIELQNQLDFERRQYDLVINSKSWKITKPLRQVKSVISRENNS